MFVQNICFVRFHLPPPLCDIWPDGLFKKITFNNLVNAEATAGTPNPPQAVQGLSLDD